MPEVERFPYLPEGSATPSPRLPLRLIHGGLAVDGSGLLDTGASLKVPPHSMGLRLGLDWDRPASRLRLSRNLAALEARAVIVEGTVGAVPPRRLAFAWTEADDVPLILGQVNFFLEFDVCFFRSRRTFEVRLKESPGL